MGFEPGIWVAGTVQVEGHSRCGLNPPPGVRPSLPRKPLLLWLGGAQPFLSPPLSTACKSQEPSSKVSPRQVPSRETQQVQPRSTFRK